MTNRKLITSRRGLIRGAGGLATMMALGAPAIAQNIGPRKMIVAHNTAPP